MQLSKKVLPSEWELQNPPTFTVDSISQNPVLQDNFDGLLILISRFCLALYWLKSFCFYLGSGRNTDGKLCPLETILWLSYVINTYCSAEISTK